MRAISHQHREAATHRRLLVTTAEVWLRFQCSNYRCLIQLGRP